MHNEICNFYVNKYVNLFKKEKKEKEEKKENNE
jgi:hypothetical protein